MMEKYYRLALVNVDPMLKRIATYARQEKCLKELPEIRRMLKRLPVLDWGFSMQKERLQLFVTLFLQTFEAVAKLEKPGRRAFYGWKVPDFGREYSRRVCENSTGVGNTPDGCAKILRASGIFPTGVRKFYRRREYSRQVCENSTSVGSIPDELGISGLQFRDKTSRKSTPESSKMNLKKIF